jgi:rod shape-determining protein MreC
VTSGKGKWFPRGIPVARVTKVNKQEIGRDQEVEAEPTVDFSRLDSVLILTTPPGELDDTKGAAKPGAPKP